MPNELPYQPPANNPAGPPFHVVQITALVNGLPTTISMEAVSIADEFGNIINNFMDYNWQRRVIDELAGIREQLCLFNRVPFVPTTP